MIHVLTLAEIGLAQESRSQYMGSVNVDHEDFLSGLWHFGKGERTQMMKRKRPSTDV